MIIPQKLERAARRFKLTPRELQTLALLSQGEPRKAIADAMDITPRGVQFHLENIFRKIGGQTSIGIICKIFLSA